MRRIPVKQLPFNTLPLARAARERELRELPYFARKLAIAHGLEASDARRRAELNGYRLDR